MMSGAGARDPTKGDRRALSTRLSDPSALGLAIVVAVGLLAFVGAPLLSVTQDGPLTPEDVVVYGVTAAFVVVYLWAIPADLAGRAAGRAAPAAVVLALLGVVIALAYRGADWTVLFIAAATAAGRISPPRNALAAIVMIGALSALVRLASDAAPARALESASEAALVGLVVLAFSQSQRTARQLARAQQEMTRLGAADERARIARDLHDLLGQSLSVMALKTELAGRLVERDPLRAAAELRDVEGIVRGSLRDIRDAVAGYRRVRLDTELVEARVALSAARIELDVQRPAGILDEGTDGLLGWVVREGVTNVVRHSGGTRCEIRIERGDQEVRLEITDDGHPRDHLGSGGVGPSGSGLSGIRDRVEAVGGRMEAGPSDGGGYRLLVLVPVEAWARPWPPAPMEDDRREPAHASPGRAEDGEPAAGAASTPGGGRS
jgi:two-component system sensor histidine kinase DesK